MKEGHYLWKTIIFLCWHGRASKGKADAAILKVCDRRSVKPKFLRKNYLLKFVKSEVTSLDTV